MKDFEPGENPFEVTIVKLIDPRSVDVRALDKPFLVKLLTRLKMRAFSNESRLDFDNLVRAVDIRKMFCGIFTQDVSEVYYDGDVMIVDLTSYIKPGMESKIERLVRVAEESPKIHQERVAKKDKVDYIITRLFIEYVVRGHSLGEALSAALRPDLIRAEQDRLESEAKGEALVVEPLLPPPPPPPPPPVEEEADSARGALETSIEDKIAAMEKAAKKKTKVKKAKKKKTKMAEEAVVQPGPEPGTGTGPEVEAQTPVTEMQEGAMEGTVTEQEPAPAGAEDVLGGPGAPVGPAEETVTEPEQAPVGPEAATGPGPSTGPTAPPSTSALGDLLSRLKGISIGASTPKVEESPPGPAQEEMAPEGPPQEGPPVEVDDRGAPDVVEGAPVEEVPMPEGEARVIEGTSTDEAPPTEEVIGPRDPEVGAEPQVETGGPGPDHPPEVDEERPEPEGAKEEDAPPVPQHDWTGETAEAEAGASSLELIMKRLRGGSVIGREEPRKEEAPQGPQPPSRDSLHDAVADGTIEEADMDVDVPIEDGSDKKGKKKGKKRTKKKKE